MRTGVLRSQSMALAVTALLMSACGGGSSYGGGGGGGGGNTAPVVGLQRAFSSLSFSLPVAMLQSPSDSTTWYVVEQGGLVRSFANSASASSTSNFVDLNGHNGFTSGGEAGLLGMAFHPQFPANPHVYLFYSTTQGTDMVNRLTEVPTTNGGQTADLANERVLLSIVKPRDASNAVQTNHNGGNILFGPDGFLYAGIGDGGGGGDDHGTIGNGQDLNTLLGKILRIDVNNGTPYAIPSGNTLSGTLCNNTGSGSGPCPEIYTIGVRNPWRFSFDSNTAALWIGDVGQDAWEEVDRVTAAGVNLGWRCREAAHAYNPTACGTATNLVDPIAEYAHPLGESITGGYVYRGAKYPKLAGYYVYADFVNKLLFTLSASAGNATQSVTAGTTVGSSISSFGQGNDGELYAVDYMNGTLQAVITTN